MSHARRISVIGLGYVGLPVAVAFGKKGAPVVAFDIDLVRIDQLLARHDSTKEVGAEDLADASLLLTSDPNDLARANFHIVTVPTPIDEQNLPDLGPLESASATVGKVLKHGDIVVYESTVYPGVTEDVCMPILEEESGLVFGKDFSVGYSPERINPGDAEHRFATITKVVSASDPETLDVVAEVYASVVDAGIHRAPSIKAAEAAKVIENTQRDLNIALMNELSLVFEKMGIDTHDVLAAARTKWNFLPFVPGLVGGHCIGVDPYYLTFQSERLGYTPEVILSGRRINDSMASRVAARVVDELNLRAAPVASEATVTVLGVSFKENVPDIRNSKMCGVIRALSSMVEHIQVVDPLVDPDEIKRVFNVSLTEIDAAGPADAVVLGVPHAPFVRGGWSMIQGLLNEGQGMVADLKASLPRDEVPPGVLLWRL